jgi:hypothetical protein
MAKLPLDKAIEDLTCRGAPINERATGSFASASVAQLRLTLSFGWVGRGERRR